MRFLLLLLLVGCTQPLTLNCPGSLNVKHFTLPATFLISGKFTENEKRSIYSAANRWNLVLGKQIITFGDSRMFIDKQPTSSFPNPRFQGLTNLQWMGPVITEVIITINQDKIGIDLESVMVHEFGHAIGLQHLDAGVMYYQSLLGEEKRDIDTQAAEVARCLYKD